MAKTDESSSVTPTPVVEDPHPGSISDGTHPSAREHKQPKATKGTGPSNHVSGTVDNPALKEGQTAVNSEAPKHPNKAAYGS
ncbi:hypothetical protein GB928_028980 [Shinella curvata]|uniref:Uncharacterized protein n=1 Tax=Shinella curvata TaxID=1817964 RepID=A0ABT8XNB8_9HYPH|nr:hypothetical protein [Shinella curvata]MCJ8056790.1 hypothetical protein [Shinella curvata]MDO6125214.1 hypothetical protein [Shinella curvata]